MAFFLAVLLFVFGLFIIIKGGDFLVRAALSLNKITGISQVTIGATFVSVATTLPEVFVSVFAVAADNHGIAVGNAIGAMIANIALVLAISLAFSPRSVRRGEVFGKTIFLLATTGLVFLFVLNLWLSWYEGVILLVAFVIFLIFNVRESNSQYPEKSLEIKNYAIRKEKVIKEENIKEKSISNRRAMWKIAGSFVFGQFMLVIGAFILVEYGEQLAHFLGISETIVGFTAIAVGTSLPELTTAIMSIRRKSGGLAIGNVIGANVINCTLLLGVCGIIGDIKGNSLPVSRELVFIALPILFIFTLIAVLPVLIRGKASRWQGFLLLGSYIAYVGYLVISQTT